MNPSASDTSLNAWSIAWSLQPSQLNAIVPLLICLTMCEFFFFYCYYFLQKIESVIRERVTGTAQTESNAGLFVASTNLTKFFCFSKTAACFQPVHFQSSPVLHPLAHSPKSSIRSSRDLFILFYEWHLFSVYSFISCFRIYTVHEGICTLNST